MKVYQQQLPAHMQKSSTENLHPHESSLCVAARDAADEAI